MVSIIIWLAVTAMLIYSIASTTEKRLSTRMGGKTAALFVIPMGLIPVLAAYILFALPANGTLALLETQNGLYFALSIISGVFFASGFAFFLKGVETQQVTNSVSITPLQYMLIVLFSVAVLGETLLPLQAIAAVLIVFGVFFVSTTERVKLNRKMMPIFMANLSWAVYWMFLSYSITHFGTESAPMLVSRVTAALVILAVYFPVFSRALRNKKPARSKSSYKEWILPCLACFAGLFDGTGNYTSGYLASLHSLAIASIISSLSPLVVLVLAFFIYRERLTRVQSIGIAIALAGAMLLAYA